MQWISALRFLLFYVVQSVACRYVAYHQTNWRPAFKIGEENEMSIQSPNAWYHHYNWYPWWRVAFPSSLTIPHRSVSDESQHLLHHISSPFLTKLGYYYIGSEYNLPNFVIRPIALEPDLHGPDCLDEDQLTSTENPMVPFKADHSDNYYPYESSTISANGEENEQNIINELSHVQDIPDNSYISANIATEMPHTGDSSFQSSTGENIPYLTQIFGEETHSNLPTGSNHSDPTKELSNENSSYNPQEINDSHFSHLTTEQSLDFNGTETEESNTQETTSNNSPDNSHISVNSEMINSFVVNEASEEPNSEVQANESAMTSSSPSIFFPLNTSEYSSDMTTTTSPSEVQLVDLNENTGNVSQSVPLFNSLSSGGGSKTPKYPGQVSNEKLNNVQFNNTDVTTEISVSEYSASSTDVSSEIVESNTVVAIVNSPILHDSSTLASESLTEETNGLEGSTLIAQQIFSANKIEPNGQVPSNENANTFSVISEAPVENLITPTTQEYWNKESVETTTVATHVSTLPELSTIVHADDSEAGDIVIQEEVVKLSNFDSSTNVHPKDYSSVPPLLPLDSFAEPTTTEILNDLSTMYVGESSLSELNDFLFMDGSIVSSSESSNVSIYAEDTSIVQNPEQVLNSSLTVISLPEESNTEKSSVLNSNAFHYSHAANGSVETSNEKLALEHSNFSTKPMEQNDKVNESENISFIPSSEILTTSSSYSEKESLSENQPLTTQNTFNVSETPGTNEQVTTSDNPLYGSTTHFPLEMTDSDNWINLTTEVSSDFKPTQEWSNEVNESENENVTIYSQTTNSDNTNIHFPTNDEDEIVTISSVVETQNSLNDNTESENDSIVFPYNEVLQEKDISENYHHNISFLETNGNTEPLHYLGNNENISSVNVHSYQDPTIEAYSNTPEAYPNVADNEKNVREDGEDSHEIKHTSIRKIEHSGEKSNNEFTNNRHEENGTKLQDEYIISSKSDVIATTLENKFLSTNDPELTSLYGDTIAMSNENENSFNKNEANQDRYNSFTTPSYNDFETSNLHIPQFSDDFSQDKPNSPAVTSLSYEKVNEDISSQQSMMRPETKYEFSHNDNKHEMVNSLTMPSTPAYRAKETENSLSLLHGDEKHTTEYIINEKSGNNFFKEEEFTTENADTDIVVDEYSFHHKNTENPSEVIFASEDPSDYFYEAEPISHSSGGSPTKFGDGFPDSFYGLKFPEVPEPSHSLKKYLPPAQDNIEEITSADDDLDDQFPYVEKSSKNSNAKEEINFIPSDSQKHLTDFYSFKESPEILDEDMYYDSQDDMYEDSLLPQENKEFYGSNAFPISLKNIPQNAESSFHRSDIPIEDEFSQGDPNSERFLQRRKRRDAILSQAPSQKPETKHKLPSGDFSAIPDESAKSQNEEVTFSREKRTFGKIPLLSMFFKKPELGFYKGQLIKNVIVRPLLQKKLKFLHKKLFLTNLLAGLLGTHDSGHFKRSAHMKPASATHPCDPCYPQTKSIHSSESRESGRDDDYYYSDDDDYYLDEKNREGAERSYKVEETPVDESPDASITDFI